MVSGELDAVFGNMGYRVYERSAGAVRVYYRYYQEGFHAVLAVDLDGEPGWNAAVQQTTAERVQGAFYRPQEILSDFPEGFPVYHVEVLTLLYGTQPERIRQLCAVCRDTWGYLGESRRLLIFENQPGDFYGLAAVLENMESGSRAAGRAKIPLVTIGLVAVNVLIFLLMELFGDTADAGTVLRWGGLYPPLIADGHQWWRLLTAGFLHFGAEHLVNNMLILYCMGDRLEHAVGHGKMCVIYLLSLLGGSLLSYGMMLAAGDYAISAGASGAVYGIIGGVLWIVIRHQGHYAGISTKRMLFMLLLTVYYGFTSVDIDNWGHIGGLAVGFCAAVILYHGKYQKD